MATGICAQCGREEYMPFVCKFCRGRFCAEHRLPENHGCAGLGAWRDRARAEGRLMIPEGGSVRPEVGAGAAFGARVSETFGRLRGHSAHVMLGIMTAVVILQVLLEATGRSSADAFLFFLGRDFLLRPWTLVTSIFAHASFYPHFFLNALVLFFFGPTLEQLIGSKRFTWLFLATGALGGVGQVFFEEAVNPGMTVAVIGASGAIMGVLGALTVLAPRISVLVFFVIPAPLWLITVLYAVGDFIFLLSPGSQVAHLAHLVGLGAGALYGKSLRDKGLRAFPVQPQDAWRRQL